MSSAARKAALKSSSSRQMFYRHGKITWSFQDQPNFASENFLRVRNRSQAWYYKVTTLAMLVLIGAIAFGGLKGHRYYQLQKEASALAEQVSIAKRKEAEAERKAQLLLDRVLNVEKRMSYDAVRLPAGTMLYNVIRRLPDAFYVQTINLTTEDIVKDTKGAPINTRQLATSTALGTLAHTVTISGRIIGMGSNATESSLVENFRSLQGFQVESTKVGASGEGVDINFRYMTNREFHFSPKPAELFSSKKPSKEN